MSGIYRRPARVQYYNRRKTTYIPVSTVPAAGGTTTPMTLTANASATVSLQKQINAIRNATPAAAVVSLQKQVNWFRAATTAVASATLKKQINKPVTATTAVASASLQKQANKVETATTAAATSTAG